MFAIVGAAIVVSVIFIGPVRETVLVPAFIGMNQEVPVAAKRKSAPK